jgi:hypothetical protein
MSYEIGQSMIASQPGAKLSRPAKMLLERPVYVKSNSPYTRSHDARMVATLGKH